ncbi:DUF6248 family natural product biosynthesis protein [Streptomyces sp. NPDC002779]|uniref:DUF6248 family natural product biosynthesis protein n=1 Tax=Streptomyces sp. NPDC002779 TaxID=3364664 RepID=UPI0036CA865C
MHEPQRPRFDEHACIITDHGGVVVAVIRHRPGQRPCPCTHSADNPGAETASTRGPGESRGVPRVVARGSAPDPEGQLTLPCEDLPEMPTASPWCPAVAGARALLEAVTP